MTGDGVWRFAGLLGLPDGDAGPVDVVVRQGIIADVAPASTPAPDGLVAVPLMINAHDHGRGTGTVRAGIADAPLEEWIPTLGSVRATQEELVGDGCRAMLAAGVGATVICVNPQGPDVAAEVSRAAAAVQRCGIRAAIVYPLADAMGDVAGRPRDAVGWSHGQLQQHLDALEEIAEGLDDPRIEFQLGPVGPQWVSDEVLRAIGSAARRSGRRVHMHLLETRSQRRWADTTYPDGIIEFLDQCDLLGPQTCFAHGTHLRADELGALAASGAVVALNPSSNLRLASGVAPVDLVLQSKGEVALGLDGMALGDDADYWSELRLLRGLGQAQSGATIAAGALLDAVLAGGRCALGACAPAPFAVGNVADFCVMDFGGYGHLQHGSRWSMAELAMAAGRPALVREVWVAGRLVWHREAGGVG